MATFRTGEQTDRAVLPQRSAPEFEPADTPGARDEAGPGGRDAVPGAEHGRGETGGATPAPEAGEEGREAHTTVRTIDSYALAADRHGMPSRPRRPARARALLAKGRAALARRTPFMIRLEDRAAFGTHAVSAGMPLEGVEYQYGTPHGHEAREYPLTKRERICAHCGVTNVPLNIGHVRPRSRGGTDRASAPALACVRCSQARGSRPAGEFVASLRTRARIPARAQAPPRATAAVGSTRWALWRVLDDRVPTHVGSGGRTEWDRTRNRSPEPHTLNALAADKVGTITQALGAVLVAGCTGRGSCARTRPDEHGSPRLPCTKGFFGSTTGDLVRAVVRRGRYTGTRTGRVAVRATGSFNTTTAHGTVQGTGHEHIRLFQRSDGYAYTTGKETGVPSSA